VWVRYFKSFTSKLKKYGFWLKGVRGQTPNINIFV
jgi:hypothetical protein